MRQQHAPCGHDWRSPKIRRTFRILFPAVWADCRCSECQATWTERFEFDFSIPLSGQTNEQADQEEAEYRKRHGIKE